MGHLGLLFLTSALLFPLGAQVPGARVKYALGGYQRASLAQEPARAAQEPAREPARDPGQDPAQDPTQDDGAARPSVQEYTASLRKAFTEARGLIKDGDPLRAMAAFDDFFRTEPPAGDFDSEDPNAVDASYTLYSLLARMHWEAARHADAIGRWERAAECYAKAAELIAGPAEKVTAACPRFAEPYENEKRQMLKDMETHADEIAALKAKSQAEYTNDDFTALDQALALERGIDVANGAIAYYAGRMETAARDVAFYGQPYAEGASAKIRLVQEQIDKYKGGRGDKAKWVEGVISDYQKQLPGYATTLEDQVSFAYRLTVLSPGSRTAPALLEWLRAKAKADAASRAALEEGAGEVTDETRAAVRDALKDAERREAELRRAIAASRPKK
jgi:hypothetical protein